MPQPAPGLRAAACPRHPGGPAGQAAGRSTIKGLKRLMAADLLKSTTTVGGMTFISRILGFIRDMVTAHLFGASAAYDAFVVAFKIPNFLRSLFAEGAFSQAFVPLLSEEQTHEKPEEAKVFINKVAGALSLVCTVVTIAGMLAAPWLIKVFAPGFDGSQGRDVLAADMLRVTFPYLLFITLTALSGGILNSYGRYGPPAFTPVLLNISMIVCACFLSPWMAEPIQALAWGCFCGGVLQLVFQIPFLRQIDRLPRPQIDWQDKQVKKLLKLMLPALVGVSIVQINLLASTLFASFLPVGSVSWLYYADRLMQFPLGVFGVAIATVVLPHLSRGYASGCQRLYCETLGWAIHTGMVVTIPAAAGLFVLAKPLIATLFQRGSFSATDTLMASQALQAYSIGVCAFILIKILAAGFYARQDIKTPVKVAGISLLVNISLSFTLIQYFAHVGLALALSLSSSLHVLILTGLLARRGVISINQATCWAALRLLLASGIMVAGLIGLNPSEQFWLVEAPFFTKLAHLLALVGGSVALYFGVLALLGLKPQALRAQAK